LLRFAPKELFFNAPSPQPPFGGEVNKKREVLWEGFSKTNLKNMRLFAKNYPNGEFSQALPDQLTWTHHIVLIQTLDTGEINVKRWYTEKMLENGWSYRELETQIKADLYFKLF
jgi:hypothetical protein